MPLRARRHTAKVQLRVSGPQLRPDVQLTKAKNGNHRRPVLVSHSPSEELHSLPGWVRDGFRSRCCPRSLMRSPGSVPAQLCGSPAQGDVRDLPVTQPAWPPHPFHQDQPHLDCFWLEQMLVNCSAAASLPILCLSGVRCPQRFTVLSRQDSHSSSRV